MPPRRKKTGIRNRVKDLRFVRAADLKPNPKNWRTHPDAQRAALRGIVGEVGIADAVLARELSDGSLQLIDGHLRAEEMPQEKLPVLVLDLSEEEADKLLATLDPLAAMAGQDDAALESLLEGMELSSPAVQAMLDDLVGGEVPPPEPAGEMEGIQSSYLVLVTCDGEAQQTALLEEFTERGLQCRALMS